MKKPKFFGLALLTSAILLVAICPTILSSNAQTLTGVYIYTSVGGTMSVNGTSITGGNTYNYTNGDSLSFTATPNSGCTFLYWEYASSAGAGVSTDNTLIYNVSTNEGAVQAMFIPNVNTTLTSSSSQTGAAPFDVPISIGGTTTPATGIYSNYTIGTVVPFTANPQSGFKFMYWLVPAAEGDAVNIVTTSQLQFNVTANACALQAFFAPTNSNITLPTISTVNEYSSAATIIVIALLIAVAFGVFAYRQKPKTKAA